MNELRNFIYEDSRYQIPLIVFSILSSVKFHCNQNDIYQAIHQVRSRQQESSQDLVVHEIKDDAQFDDHADLDSRENVMMNKVQLIMKEGCSEETAKAAIKILGLSVQVGEAVSWCIECIESDEHISNLARQFDEDMMLVKQTDQEVRMPMGLNVQAPTDIIEVGSAQVRQHSSESPNDDSDYSAITLESESEVTKIRIVIKAVKDAGFSEKMAKAGMVECGLDEEEIIGWCYDNFEDDDVIDRLSRQWDERMEEEEAVLDNTLDDNGMDIDSRPKTTPVSKKELVEAKDDLINELQLIWHHHRNTLESDDADFGIDHLGNVLTALAHTDPVAINRPWKLSDEYGRPHLLIKPQDEMLSTALNIYLNSDNIQLPSHDEVLLCTPQTTLEQVVLFYRRAMFDTNGKIYCLMNADLLDYDVSTKAEEKRNDLGRKAVSEYRLIVICSQEREDRTHIVTALDSYRSDPPDWPLVKSGVNELLFNLIVLGGLTDKHGRVWRRHPFDLYVIEILHSESNRKTIVDIDNKDAFTNQPLYTVLPTIVCRSPKETLLMEKRLDENKSIGTFSNVPLMDDTEFRSVKTQRVFQYLARHTIGVDLDYFDFVKKNEAGDSYEIEGNHVSCLETLLRHCGINDPTWSELRNFVVFLNEQLKDCETSLFCNIEYLDDTHLYGFRNFVVRFMIQMAKDFATPSLQCSDQSSLTLDNGNIDHEHITCQELPSDVNGDMDNIGDDLTEYQLKRKWETSAHPYIFFNYDHTTMTFIGFNIDRFGNLIDPVNDAVIERGVMSNRLRAALKGQNVDLRQDYDAFEKEAKLQILCQAIGVRHLHDPDETYELTSDNAKKILAIYMRLRCGIPVVVMGETGSGKTRLIKYLYQLLARQNEDKTVENMILMKIHGGTTTKDIVKKVGKAQQIAAENKEKRDIDTVLFFDEANTTENIGLIKEIMCDKRMNGERISCDETSLRFIVACNPYRRHEEKMIAKLESAGLGYRIKAKETDDKLGRVPLRQLVYRVQPLPPNMMSLVWDFGQLSQETEKLYIRQIVKRYKHHIPPLTADCEVIITNILSSSQEFMRQTKNECSFVSLRDVERTMDVLVWFYKHPQIEDQMREQKEKDKEDTYMTLNPLTLALVLALGVCYHACLQDERERYRNAVVEHFTGLCDVPGGGQQFWTEINRCQDLFLEELQVPETIARNAALKENVFMMVICIDMRIPLFLVGKPGSSKSLAKTIVANAMQGENSTSKLFTTFKQVFQYFHLK
ncbi:E3 ubiquitin-protein ligase rnf213-alpha-like [Saccoglossus kowalevskii]